MFSALSACIHLQCHLVICSSNHLILLFVLGDQKGVKRALLVDFSLSGSGVFVTCLSRDVSWLLDMNCLLAIPAFWQGRGCKMLALENQSLLPMVDPAKTPAPQHVVQVI